MPTRDSDNPEHPTVGLARVAADTGEGNHAVRTLKLWLEGAIRTQQAHVGSEGASSFDTGYYAALTHCLAQVEDALKASPVAAAPTPGAAHGRDCPKVPHLGEGYLHGQSDDHPYNVDGVLYCGRCHGWLGIAPIPHVAGGAASQGTEKG